MSALRLSTAFKALLQMGLEPLSLYALYQLELQTGYYRRINLKTGKEDPAAPTIRYLFSLPTTKQLLQCLGSEGKTALLKEADEITGGQVRLFGGEPVPLQLQGDWPGAHWTDYARGRVKPEGDIKLIWEPARFGWAFLLGRAYRLSGDEHYSEAFWNYTETFLDHNPLNCGPNWMNGQEVAIRLMAIVWALQVFSASPHSTPQRRDRLARSIAEHARRIPPTLIYARSQNNNHLITEAAALFSAGCALPDQPHSARWRELGWMWLNLALQRQISSYGEYIQHSSNYHRLMLQAVLWVDAIMRVQSPRLGHALRWPAASLEPLMRAAHWLFSMIDPATGRTPNLGANDGALIFPLSTTPFDDFRPTVQAAARSFLRIGLPAGPWDEMALWLGLQPSDRTSDSDAYLTDHLRGRDSWAYLRASRFKSRLTHMDQLHFDLWWHGLNIARDPGTYLYNADPPWDNPLVSTRVHNTITVDGRDQMSRGGRFLTLDWFPAYSQNRLETDEHILGRTLSYHKGYRRLGIRHERVATVYMDERWEVRDNLVFTQPGKHNFRLHWLLPDWEWKIENRERKIELRLKSPQGPIRLVLQTSLPDLEPAACASLVRSGELLYGSARPLPFEGWYSPTYSQKIPALSLALDVSSNKSFSLTSEFIFPATGVTQG